MPSALSSNSPDGKRLSNEATSQTAHANMLANSADHRPELAAGVAILGSDAEISSWNPQAAAMTGYTLEQVRRVGLVSLFEPQDVIRHIVHKGYCGVPTLSEYLHLRHADGRTCAVVVQCAPQRQLHQSECQVVLVFRTMDVPIEHLRQDAHLMVMGRFASSLSHEIRNQLNTVMLHTDVLEDVLQDVAPETRHLLMEPVGDIRHEIARLHDLVENVLSLARLSRLDRAPVRLDSFFESLRDEIAPFLAAQNIRLHLDYGTDLGELRLHTNTFRHLWLNLIHNAIDAMPDGGDITIRGQRSTHQVSLIISDAGPGIADDQMPLLFVPFHTNKPNGTGLGLYVVQEIAAAHQGWIDVSSEPGVGTSFTLNLPISASDESTVASD